MVQYEHRLVMCLYHKNWENIYSRSFFIRDGVFTSSQNALFNDWPFDGSIFVELPHTTSIIHQIIKCLTTFIKLNSQSSVWNVTDFAQMRWPTIIIFCFATFIFFVSSFALIFGVNNHSARFACIGTRAGIHNDNGKTHSHIRHGRQQICDTKNGIHLEYGVSSD